MKNIILKKGLTIVEMLVVVSIVVLFSALVFGNYSVGKDGLALERAAQKLTQDYRRAQEIAMAGSFGTSYNAVGLFFDESSPYEYVLYNNYETAAPIYYNYDGGGMSQDTEREAIAIEAGIKICDIIDNDNDGGTPVSPTSISVSFAPPEPVTRINEGNTDHDVSIVLCVINDNSKIKVVNINNLGRIDVNNQ
ncbi:MAG TPA: type II secretion system protein [Candidatus Pacearchaeota archaeon]|jgi:prepilin-type N-terminal cleavage/methylation domain-containing protein|nr:type II secretion system protein [Candidatus Pacearchaeota archaeon]